MATKKRTSRERVSKVIAATLRAEQDRIASTLAQVNEQKEFLLGKVKDLEEILSSTQQENRRLGDTISNLLARERKLELQERQLNNKIEQMTKLHEQQLKEARRRTIPFVPVGGLCFPEGTNGNLNLLPKRIVEVRVPTDSSDSVFVIEVQGDIIDADCGEKLEFFCAVHGNPDEDRSGILDLLGELTELSELSKHGAFPGFRVTAPEERPRASADESLGAKR